MANEVEATQPEEEITNGTPPAAEFKLGLWARFKHWRLRRLLRDPHLLTNLTATEASKAKQVQASDRWERTDKLKAPLWVLLGGLAIVFAVGAAKPMLPHYPEGSLSAFWSEVLSLFGAEVGVALIVAYVIGRAIDAQARRREERARERERLAEVRRRKEELEEAILREQRLVQDVFRGVLGIRHSSAYVRKVIETTLEQRVIRRTVNLIYTLRRLNPEEAARIGDGERFLVLDEAMSYEFQNLSSEEFELEIRLAVPVRHGKALRDESRLQAVTIGDKAVEADELVEEKDDEGPGDAKKYLWKRMMPANGKLAVALKVRLIKEMSDTEVWCSFYPCSEGMSLQVVASELNLHMGIRNNTASRCKMETDPSDNGVGVWKIEGPILPNDSVVFYWRTPEDEGEGPTDGAEARTLPPPAPAPAPNAVDTTGSPPPEARPDDSLSGTTEAVGD